MGASPFFPGCLVNTLVKEKRLLYDYLQFHTKKITLPQCLPRYFEISQQSFYAWKEALAEKGKEGLINSRPCLEDPKLRIPPEIEEKILYVRRAYHLVQILGEGHPQFPGLPASSTGNGVAP